MSELGTVEIGPGHHVFVRDWGAGQPVLFLAGWAMTSDLWGDVMVSLNAGGLRTIAYDRRGHGRSSDPGVISYDALADDLAAVIETLGLEDVTIVAHSGAAGEAIRYLERGASARVRRLVLVGASGPCLMQGAENPDGIPGDLIEQSVRQVATDLSAWIEANAEPFAPGASRRTLDWLGAMVLGCSRRVAIDFQRIIAEADWRPQCSKLELPVTIIHGTHDASAPLDLSGRRFAALIPRSELLIYEGAAHGLMVTHSQRLAADIRARVQGRGP